MLFNLYHVSALLGLVGTAQAYQITSPSGLSSSGGPWTESGPDTITWERVSTDPETFAIVLVNEDRSVLPVNNLVLASSVDGTLLSIAVSPPSGSKFPVGSGYRVNVIKSATDVNTIYAQSPQFRIVPDSQASTATATEFGGTNTQIPRTTYIAPSPTETVTVTASKAESSHGSNYLLIWGILGLVVAFKVL